jgi:hypothetical protein
MDVRMQCTGAAMQWCGQLKRKALSVVLSSLIAAIWFGNFGKPWTCIS